MQKTKIELYPFLCKQIPHLNGSNHSIRTFVTSLSTSTFNSLLYSIGGQNSIGNWNTGLQRNSSNTFCRFIGNHLKMSSCATYNCPQTNNRRVLSALSHFLCNQRNLKSTGRPHNIQIIRISTMPQKSIFCSRQQFSGYKFIESCHCNSNMQIVR